MKKEIKYVLIEEFNALIKRADEKNREDIKEALNLIYKKGYYIRDVVKNYKFGIRALEIWIQRASKRMLGYNIKLSDLRKSYLYSHPEILYQRGRNGKVREPISLKLRWEVFSKDNFKCVACGSKENLQVDHIIPFSLGGKTEISNLQTLCQDCNFGKRDNSMKGPVIYILPHHLQTPFSCAEKRKTDEI